MSRRAWPVVRWVALAFALVVALPFAGYQLLLALGPSLSIPQRPTLTPPREFIGEPARPRPVRAREAPRHPFKAPNGRSVIHGDAYMTGTHAVPGPLGRGIETKSTFMVGECASLTFDSQGRIVTLCVRVRGRFLALLDPVTLERLATYDLPPRPLRLGGLFTDFSGGGYFYLDQRDQAVVPTTTRHIYVVGLTDEPGFELVRDIDLTAVVPSDDAIQSVLPDWEGRLWFVTTGGIVGVLPQEGREPQTVDLGEGIGDSLAVDETGGVYVVSDTALYRFDAGREGTPRVSWRETYPNSGVQKPGQIGAGSGTTPTLLGGRWVAIADNAERMGVLVFRRERGFRGRRLVCRQPVFERGRSATENSLIGVGRSVLVENNYGYSGPAATLGGGTTEPGFARVDLDSEGRGCRVVWESDVRAPSVVPKLSLANGLVYTYVKPPNASTAPWYLTALDFRTGRTVFMALAGRDLGFNNHYAPITLGPDGSAYVGVLGGLVRLADSGP
jgi:hypothetical protein